MLNHQLNIMRVVNSIVFKGAGWFYGFVAAVQEEENVCQVRFYSSNEPSATITVEESDRICEDPDLGEIGFQFVKQFRGNSIIGRKIESISSKKKYVCRFDGGDIQTYLIQAMTMMMIKKFLNLGT